MAKRPYRDRFGPGNTTPFRVAVGASVAVHVALIFGLGVFFAQRADLIEPKVANVKFYAEKVEPAPPVEEPKPPEPEPPKPDPPKPKEPEKKPDPPKEKPKPKEPEKKPEPKKEKPKPKEPEKKPDPPKEKPKPKEPEKKPEPKKTPAAPAPITSEPVKPGVTMKDELPSVLSYWIRRVVVRVERNWRVPGGVRADADDNTAMVSFWVNRKGELTSEPQIVKAAKDPAVGISAVRSIKASAPFLPLPEDYTEREVQVIFTFVPTP